MRTSGLTTATLANKQIYLTAFFTWALNATYYPAGDNPAERHIKQSAREKRHRRKDGFRAFTTDQIRTLYAPKALAAVNLPTRWGALVGLYTGARVSEVGQLMLSDVFERDGVPCLRITADGFGQSLKNDASERVTPIHPDLVRLGLLEPVEALRAQGERQLFPKAKAGSVNGMGNWLSKTYGRHLNACGVSPAGRGKVGFHSLRKTAIEAMTLAGIRAEARAQYVGHELTDEHHAAYGYEFLKNELLHGVGKGPNQTAGIDRVSYGLDLPALKPVLFETTRERKGCT